MPCDSIPVFEPEILLVFLQMHLVDYYTNWGLMVNCLNLLRNPLATYFEFNIHEASYS